LAPLLGFGTTSILRESCHSRQKKIDKKNSIKKFLYFSHTYNTLEELLGISKKRPSASYQLNCPEKIIIEKNIKIIMLAVDSCLTAMVCHNLRQACLLEVGMTQIPVDHAALSIVCRVGLYVDFSSTNFSLDL
jgi:hypothetical protein